MPSRQMSHARQSARPEARSRDARQDTAHYIAEMAAELAAIAEDAEFDLLAYFLKMAQLEAEACLRGEE